MKLASPILLSLFICSSLLAGCGDKTEQTANTQTEARAQLANPASEYCVSLGGTLEIQKNVEGEQGMCTLPNGEKIEEWALFRRDHP